MSEPGANPNIQSDSEVARQILRERVVRDPYLALLIEIVGTMQNITPEVIRYELGQYSLDKFNKMQQALHVTFDPPVAWLKLNDTSLYPELAANDIVRRAKEVSEGLGLDPLVHYDDPAIPSKTKQTEVIMEEIINFVDSIAPETPPIIS
jgi:hypothetical protein